jgi:hypothetical protein
MNKVSSSLTKDVIIIISIIIVFLAVVLVFYTEILKNRKIKDTKINYDFVKEELLKEIYNCKTKEHNLFFDVSCQQKLTKKIISDYFNNNKKIKNPYDDREGFGGNPGSVQIEINDELIILSIDIDANGGVDIEDKIKY